MNNADIEKLLRKDHKVEVPGFIILFIADILRERQIAIWGAEEVAEREEFNRSDIARLKEKGLANEAAGALMLELMEQAFGRDFMESFCEGKINLNLSIIETENETIN